MTFKLFYTDYSEDEHIRSDEAVPATPEDIIACMNRLLHEPDNFIGIIDGNDATLQFMVEDNGMICIDVPDQERKGSTTKTTDLDECINVVDALQQNIVLGQIDGLEFKSWSK